MLAGRLPGPRLCSESIHFDDLWRQPFKRSWKASPHPATHGSIHPFWLKVSLGWILGLLGASSCRSVKPAEDKKPLHGRVTLEDDKEPRENHQRSPESGPGTLVPWYPGAAQPSTNRRTTVSPLSWSTVFPIRMKILAREEETVLDRNIANILRNEILGQFWL